MEQSKASGVRSREIQRIDRQILLTRKFAQTYLKIATQSEKRELELWAQTPQFSDAQSPIVKSMVNCFVGNTLLLHIVHTVHNGHFREASAYILLDKRYQIPEFSQDRKSDQESGKLQKAPLRSSFGKMHFNYELPKGGRTHSKELVSQVA